LINIKKEKIMEIIGIIFIAIVAVFIILRIKRENEIEEARLKEYEKIEPTLEPIQPVAAPVVEPVKTEPVKTEPVVATEVKPEVVETKPEPAPVVETKVEEVKPAVDNVIDMKNAPKKAKARTKKVLDQKNDGKVNVKDIKEAVKKTTPSRKRTKKSSDKV
jgi:hypothetical protein